MSSLLEQGLRLSGSSAGVFSLKESAPWTSGCYARIASLEVMLEIRERRRMHRLRLVGALLMVAGCAATAAVWLLPF